MTNYSRSVLKSNGLRRPKSGLKSLTFRPKPFPQISPKSYRHNAVSNRFSSHFSTSLTNAPRLLSLLKAGTHSPFGKRSHTRAHTAKQGCSDEGAVTTLGAFRTFTNIPGPGIRTANFAALGTWSRVLSKNAESLRNSDALMRVAVPRRRGPTGLRDLFATW